MSWMGNVVIVKIPFNFVIIIFFRQYCRPGGGAMGWVGESFHLLFVPDQSDGGCSNCFLVIVLVGRDRVRVIYLRWR